MKRCVLGMPAVVKYVVRRFVSLANLRQIHHVRALVVLTEVNAQPALSFV
jgi:hypothetical protein